MKFSKKPAISLSGALYQNHKNGIEESWQAPNEGRRLARFPTPLSFNASRATLER